MEQHSCELPVSEPEHEHADEPEQQHGIPAGPEFRWNVWKLEFLDGTDRFPVRTGKRLIGEIKP
ncbi:MAG: hypothetical protein SGI77_02410 [Pirellulaceae bacterium]|nr:hypothetical protein [Pirellulaceae bacterium]